MTKKYLTTDNLVKSIERRAMLPLNRDTLTKQDIIDIMNEELDLHLVPFLLSNHEEYLVNYSDYPLIAGDNNFIFKIPPRAVGNKLRMVSYLNDTGIVTKLTRIEPEDLVYFQRLGYQSFSYWVENDTIRLVNRYSIANATKLRMHFAMSPSKLVEDKYSAKIVSIDGTTGTIVVDKIPSNFTNTGSYEFTGGDSPNKLIKYDVPALSINTVTKEMMFDPTSLKNIDYQLSILNIGVGDIITVSGESIVPQGIPTELHPLLAEMAAVHCLEALGDLQNIQIAAARLQKMKESTSDLIDNRVEGSNQKINNLTSPMNQTRLRTNRGFW